MEAFEKKKEDDLDQKGKTKVQEEDDHHTTECARPKPSSQAIPSQSHLATRFRVLLASKEKPKEKLQEPNPPLDPHFKKLAKGEPMLSKKRNLKIRGRILFKKGRMMRDHLAHFQYRPP